MCSLVLICGDRRVDVAAGAKMPEPDRAMGKRLELMVVMGTVSRFFGKMGTVTLYLVPVC